MAVQRTLELDFVNEFNKTHKMRVYNAQEDINPAQIIGVMDDIITANIFSGSGGALTGKKSARMVVRETTDFDLV